VHSKCAKTAKNLANGVSEMLTNPEKAGDLLNIQNHHQIRSVCDQLRMIPVSNEQCIKNTKWK